MSRISVSISKVGQMSRSSGLKAVALSESARPTGLKPDLGPTARLSPQAHKERRKRKEENNQIRDFIEI